MKLDEFSSGVSYTSNKFSQLQKESTEMSLPLELALMLELANLKDIISD